MTGGAWILSILWAGIPLTSGEDTGQRPFDQRLIDALVKGTEDPAPLVKDRPRGAFEIFHVYVDAGIAWELEGKRDRARFAWDLGEKLAALSDQTS